jgi:hypothetical protein
MIIDDSSRPVNIVIDDINKIKIQKHIVQSGDTVFKKKEQ